MSQPNSTPKLYIEQVGGTHYGTGYGHWDYCKDASTPYLPGHATKYLVRWRGKNGIEDLRKSLSFVDKMMDDLEQGHVYENNAEQFNHLLERMFSENNVPSFERLMIYEIVNWSTWEDLHRVRFQLAGYIADQQALEKNRALRASLEHSGEAEGSYTNQG